jgi:putative transposase
LACLRFVKGHKVGRKWVLRIMREHQLLSSHRVVQGQPIEQAEKIITVAPNVQWGTDGTKILTLDDGWCLLFTDVEHWNAECLEWHLTKTGDRFAALQPLFMALMTRFESVGADVARGLALRMDNSTQYLSDHFQNQIRYWGIAPSFAFVAESETNDVAERFNRILKEQVIYGRQYKNIEELRIAISDFIELYNKYWMAEKLIFKKSAAGIR